MARRDKDREHKSDLIAIDDPTRVRFVERRPGCGKHVVRALDAFELSIYRLEPGARVPTHAHSRSHDLFVAVHGEIRIETPRRGRRRVFVLRPGGVCSIPPGTRHEVLNTDTSRTAYFVLVHAPFAGFDFLTPRT